MITATVGGNVGSVEMKATNDGTPFLSFSVASNERGKGGQDVTTWVRCALYGKRAESLNGVLSKGSSVMVSGTVSLREYEGKNGKGVSLDMRVDNLAFIGGKGGGDHAGNTGGDAPAQRQGGQQARPAQGRQGGPAPQRQTRQAPPVDDGGGYGGSDDDLPF